MRMDELVFDELSADEERLPGHCAEQMRECLEDAHGLALREFLVATGRRKELAAIAMAEIFADHFRDYYSDKIDADLLTEHDAAHASGIIDRDNAAEANGQ